MNKSEKFDNTLQELAQFARVLSHPARLAILQYLAQTKTCKSGDISESLPLSRTTVSQHLKELRDIGLIHGEIDGLKINYCLFPKTLEKYWNSFSAFYQPLMQAGISCETHSCK